MTVDHVANLKSGQAYLPNTSRLIVNVIAFNSGLSTDMGKDTISFAFTNIECLSISRIDESVDIRL